MAQGDFLAVEEEWHFFGFYGFLLLCKTHDSCLLRMNSGLWWRC